MRVDLTRTASVTVVCMNSHIHPCSLIKGEIIQRLRNRGALSEGRGKVIHCIRPGRKMPRRAVVRIQFAIMQEAKGKGST